MSSYLTKQLIYTKLESMEWLIIEKSKAVAQALCHLLIPFGIQGILVDTPEEAKETWRNNKKISGAIVDIDNQTMDGLSLLKELKSEKENSNLILIAHTASNEADLPVKMHNNGITGILTKPFEIKTVSNELQNILQKIQTGGSEKRKHIRICPDPEDMMRIFFQTHAQGPLLSGKVINISMGGVAIELLQPLKKAGTIRSGALMYRFEIILGSHALKIPTLIALSKGKFIAFKFKQLNFQNKSVLARYIYKRITKNAIS